jgi:hypothetical protein
MIGIESGRKQGVVRGCILPVLTVIGVLAACYGLCMILFLLNQAGTSSF